MSITAKFGLGGSLFLVLIVMVAATGYFSLTIVRNAEKSIFISSEIQRLVLDMDRGMEKSRRLYYAFFLQYPFIGFEKAHQQYLQPAIRQAAKVITISQALKRKIELSTVSSALEKTQIDLNLYLSSATRFAKTSIKSVELVTQIFAPDRGLEAQLVGTLGSLEEALVGHEFLLGSYHEMESYTLEYRIIRKRFLMQSAFNSSFRLSQQIRDGKTLDRQEKEKIIRLLDKSMEIAKKILEIDVHIKSIINDFSLQERAVAPISSLLVQLVTHEVTQAKRQIASIHRVAVILMAGIALLGVFVALGIGKLLNVSITEKLVQLTKTATELRRGNLDVFVDEGAGDEIGQLAVTFNVMTARIKEFVNGLESQVKLRTNELQTVNETLLREVDDRIKAEQAKENLELQLRQAHKMEAIGTLAGGIAHDFNNLLAAIIGYADLAKAEIPEGNPAKLQIEEVLKAGDRAKNLVKQILTFSRKSELELVLVQIPLIVTEAVDFLRASIPTTIDIRLDIDSDCRPVLADQTQIYQVILNLCTNAAQAMENEGGVLEIRLNRMEITPAQIFEYPDLKTGFYVKLTVKDSGQGIEKQIMDKIFDPYFTTKKIGKGSGMGLAMVHGIVKRHRGLIRVSSTPGIGSEFQIFLPESMGKMEVMDKKSTPLLTGTEHILVVDDEPAIVDVTRMRLERLGYRVTSHTSSQEALSSFRRHPDQFDLVITDQTMPHLTGENLAKEMISIQKDIPIILSTGYSSKIDETKTEKTGIRAVLMKPTQMKELADCIRRVLGDPS